jgi:hypothetical protein
VIQTGQRSQKKQHILASLGAIVFLSGCGGEESLSSSKSLARQERSGNESLSVFNPDLVSRQLIKETYRVVQDGEDEWLEYTMGLAVSGRQASLPINHPPIVATGEAHHMLDDDHVVGVLSAGEARAYPWWILSSGHLANDMIQGRPVVVSMCEKCSGISAFVAEVDGMPLDFRMAGVHKGTWFSSDYQTGSYWHPFTGRAWRGPLKGKRMEPLGTYQARWAEWKRDHPNSTVVLGSEEQRRRKHARHDNAVLKFPGRLDILEKKKIQPERRNPRRDLMEDSTMVYGLIGLDGNRAKVFPLESLRNAGGLVQDQLGESPVVLMHQGEFQVGAFRRDLEGEKLDFNLVSETPLVVEDQYGTRWNLWGQAIAGPAQGSQLPLATGYLTEWYEWLYSFPETEVFGEGD